MAKAYSYIRFSTPEQSKGTSLDRQVSRAEAYATQHGLELDQSLTFRDLGVSAFKKANIGKEGKLAKFLSAVDSGLVAPGSHLLVESLDRLTRAGIGDALDLFLSILRRQIVIHSLMDGAVYRHEDMNSGLGFQQLIVSLTILFRANEESRTKSDRIKRAWEAKRLKADATKLTSIAPAWMTYDEATSAFKFEPERVAVVRRIVSLVMSGLGSSVICKRLNKEGVQTFTERSAEGGWYRSYIKKILRNRALIGEFQPHRETEDGKRVPDGPSILDYFPAVLEPEEFAELQAVLGARDRTGGRRGEAFSNLFTGLLKCGYCGSTVSYVSKGYDKGDRSKPMRYLVCSRAKRGAGCCYISWPYQEFEASFLKLARSVEFRSTVAGLAAGGGAHEQRDQLDAMRAAVSEIELQLERLVSAIASGSGRPQAIMDRIAQQETERGMMLERIKAAEAAVEANQLREASINPMLNRLNGLQEKFDEITGDELYDLRANVNQSLRQQLSVIIIYGGGFFLSPEKASAMRNDADLVRRHGITAIEAQIARCTLPETKKNRFFQIIPMKGKMQLLHPGAAIPDIDDAIASKQDALSALPNGVPG